MSSLLRTIEIPPDEPHLLPIREGFVTEWQMQRELGLSSRLLWDGTDNHHGDDPDDEGFGEEGEDKHRREEEIWQAGEIDHKDQFDALYVDLGGEG